MVRSAPCRNNYMLFERMVILNEARSLHSKETSMEHSDSGIKQHANRRSFLKLGTVGAGTAVGTTLLPAPLAAFEEDGASLTKGDIAILTVLSALQQVA